MRPIREINALAGSIRTNTSGESTPHSSGTLSSVPTDASAQRQEAVCPICKGAGYLRLDVPVGHPNFGRIIPCECKIREREAKLLRQYLELSGLEQLEDWTFETFDPTVPGVGDAYRIALEYARNPDGWLLLMGSYGCGKTHLAAAIANYVLRHQRLFPLFTVVPDLLDYLRATFAPDRTESYDDRFEQVRNAGLLVLDDLGTEHTTPWATEKLFQIINYRYNQRKPTVITTNRDLDDLDERIRSRLCDRAVCRAVFIRAGDYRLRRSRVTP
jgi:DNA replication protein DnaC